MRIIYAQYESSSYEGGNTVYAANARNPITISGNTITIDIKELHDYEDEEEYPIMIVYSKA